MNFCKNLNKLQRIIKSMQRLCWAEAQQKEHFLEKILTSMFLLDLTMIIKKKTCRKCLKLYLRKFLLLNLLGFTAQEIIFRQNIKEYIMKSFRYYTLQSQKKQ